MSTWFTADLHLGHHNIIEYCERPFRSVGEMNRTLVERWNAVVQPCDIVWVLGDVAMGQIDDSLSHIRELTGYKILVAGNHDRCWYAHGERAAGWVDRYLDAGFDEIVQGSPTIEVGGVETLASHFPYEGDSHHDDRYDDHRPVDEGAWLLHGHVHDCWAVRDRMINVGVDVRDYAPMSQDAVAEIITGVMSGA